MRFLGVDLAWATSEKPNETGVLALELDGTIVDAGWTTVLKETVDWIERWAAADCLLFVDAPLVVPNPPKTMRQCEREVGQRFGRHYVSANTTNQGSPRLAGRALRKHLEQRGWRYDDGVKGPPTAGRLLSECYPYTTLVGAAEFGLPQYRPAYKRRPRSVPTSEWRAARAATCDGIVRSLERLVSADPPMDLRSNAATRSLLDEPSPLLDRDYKHREDLIDACLCAWTAALWRTDPDRCQVLGAEDTLLDASGHRATIVSAARPPGQ